MMESHDKEDGSSYNVLEERMGGVLERKRQDGSYRRMLTLPNLEVDFSSNDYMGLSRCSKQKALVEARANDNDNNNDDVPFLGATGSRLLSGQSGQYEELEAYIANVHGSQHALLCSSGYMANLSLLSCLPCDVLLLDELVHNSLHMGTRIIGKKKRLVQTFPHNRMDRLEQLLLHKTRSSNNNKKHKQTENCSVVIVVESVYSMDGDIAPLAQILDLASQYQALVIVDEAHGFGVYGRTNLHNLYHPSSDKLDYFTEKYSYSHCRRSAVILPEKEENKKLVVGGTGVLASLELEQHPALLAAVYTYGKAAGCHGAVIVSNIAHLIPYLVNYARPFIYSTALPSHALHTIMCAYQTITSTTEGDKRRTHLFSLVKYFIQTITTNNNNNNNNNDNDDDNLLRLLPSPSPIQAVLCPGNHECISMAKHVSLLSGIHVYPIRSPTVPKGQERIRIILHAHNTMDQVKLLVETLRKSWNTLNDEKTHTHLIHSKL